MDQILVDDAFTRQVPETSTPCIVVNSAGKRLGYFTPEVDRAWYQGLEPSISEAEMERREQAGGGRSLADILADLRQGH